MPVRTELLGLFRTSHASLRFSKRLMANRAPIVSLHAMGADRHPGSSAGRFRISEIGYRMAMTIKHALDMVRRNGVMLESGTGPVPNLAELIAGEPIKGSWWAHPKTR